MLLPVSVTKEKAGYVGTSLLDKHFLIFKSNASSHKSHPEIENSKVNSGWDPFSK